MKKLIAMMMAAVMLLGLVACGGAADNSKSVDLNEVYKSVEGNLPTMLLMDEQSMMNYYGVDASLCNQVILSICGDGLRADELWLVEAKDEASLKTLKAMAESRLTAKEDETIDYTPDQYEVVKEAELYTKGLYLVFIVSPDVDTMKAAIDAALQ